MIVSALHNGAECLKQSPLKGLEGWTRRELINSCSLLFPRGAETYPEFDFVSPAIDFFRLVASG